MAQQAQRTTRARRTVGRGSRWLRAAARELWGRSPVTAPDPDRSSAGRRALVALGALLAYAALAVLVTYPLVWHFTTALPSNVAGGDELQNYWNFWWAREALSRGQNPYWMPLVYAPDGATLYLHTLNLFNGLLSIPFQLVFGPIPAYNMVIILSFVFAAVAAALLVTHLTGHRAAGFVGGVVYAFGSYHMGRMLGHTNLLASEWLPVYALCLIRANETGGRARSGFVAGAVVALLLLALCDWQFVMFALFLTLTYSLYRAIARRSLRPTMIAAAIGVLWCLLAAPLLLPTFAEIGSGRTALPTLDVITSGSADLLSYVVPGPRQRQWGAWPGLLNDHLRAQGDELAGFIGYLPLLLGAVAIWLNRRRARFWVVAALVFVVLSLGPYLRVGGNVTTLPLPYLLVARVPGLSVARVPARFSVLVILCIAVLVGLAVAALARGRVARLPRAARAGLVLVLVGALVAEHVALPVPLAAVPRPRPFYVQLGASGEPGTIMEWPYCKQCPQTNFDQTVHRHPVVGGYLSRRILDYPIRALPPHADIPSQDADIIKDPLTPEEVGRWALRYTGVRWIVLNLEDEGYKTEEMPPFLAAYAEPGPLYRDDTMEVYHARQPEGGQGVYLELRDGWLKRERVPDRPGWARWFSTEAALVAWNFGDAPHQFTLAFDAWSFGRARRLQVVVDERPVGQWVVQAQQHLEIPLTLTPGQHQIALVSLDPPTSPADTNPASADTRQLAFNISELELRR